MLRVGVLPVRILRVRVLLVRVLISRVLRVVILRVREGYLENTPRTRVHARARGGGTKGKTQDTGGAKGTRHASRGVGRS